MKNRLISLPISLLTIITRCMVQGVRIKTNFLYWGTATPNLGIEVRVAPYWTIDLSSGYSLINPINKETGLKWMHSSALPEARCYLCEVFNGHSFGLRGPVGFYSINRLNVPIGRLERLKGYYLQGWGYGAGITYGYERVLAKHWNLGASTGTGCAPFDCIRYSCRHCSKMVTKERKNYLGPTKATPSLIYLF